ncbi:efflux RND transporter periplasmic adaptor subunit [Methylomonas sp. HYX-M1]|uniref:efflux RND transporter periplasmic adaptor subunit n=1 Tax=Methylomonas sp. HYX-M1 TaxID=3139307 RepID=UPI00345BDE77
MSLKRSSVKTLLPVAVLLGAVGAAWAMIELRPGRISQDAQAILPVVQVWRAEPQTLRLTVETQGVVTPREEIDLIAQVGGQVQTVHPALASGGFFAANEVLVRIDPRDYDYAIAAAEAGVAEAQRVLINEKAQAEQALSDWQALGQGEAGDLALRKPQLAEAQAKLSAAQAELAKAGLNRSRCDIRAPFAGRVLNKRIGRGQFLSPGSPVARIYANDVAEIRLPIAVDDLAFLALPLTNPKNPQWPQVRLQAEIGGRSLQWPARIVRSEAALDSDNGQLFLIAQVDDPERAVATMPLFSGLFVQAQIEGITRDKLFVLPRASINNLQQVKLVNADRRLELRQVRVLRNQGGNSIVSTGLTAGERVVVSELPLAVAGMQVQIADDGDSGVLHD